MTKKEKVRDLPKNYDDLNDFEQMKLLKDHEWEQTCGECKERTLAVRPPQNIIDKVKKDITKDYLFDEWLGDHWFHCKKCQKEFELEATQ